MGATLIAERYRLDEKIGAGGMGVVWRATDLELGRVVALKRSQSGDGGQIRREARIGAGLQHPNVVTVYDAVIHDEDRWLVMEYLPSRSLSAILDEDGPLAPEEVARVGAQVANALAAMHARGMLHRDIKPGNVLVAEDGTAKLTDLGIARWAEETRTDTGLIGTPGYVAPEVADGGASTAAADLFSLGATLFAAVEGSSPWGDRDTPFRQLRRAAAFELEPARRAGALKPVLDALLRQQPKERPSAADASRLLSDIAGTQPFSAPPKRRRFRISRRLAIAGSIGLVVLIAALVATLLLVNDDPEITADTTGDPRTADPCGMFDLDALREFGEPNLDRYGGLFNECFVQIHRPDDEADIMNVTVKLDLPPDRQLALPEAGRIPLPEQTPESDGKCDRTVILPDSNVFTVNVVHWSSWTAPLCDVANSVVLSALDVFNRGQIPRRAPIPEKSIALVDACSLLSEQDVEVSLGGPTKSDRLYAGWACSWVRGPKEITLWYAREPYPLELDDDEQAITVGTRPAILEIGTSAWPDACQVELEYRPIDDEPTLTETVELYVESEDTPPETHCAEARALASRIDERLP